MVFARLLGLAVAGLMDTVVQELRNQSQLTWDTLPACKGQWERITRQRVDRETMTFQDQVPQWAAEASSGVDFRKAHFREVFWDPVDAVVSV